jgi:hypothetical protein
MAQGDRELASVAHEDGFAYRWMPTENGVTLSLADVHVVLHAGSRFYEVDDVLNVADEAPVYDGRDLVISQQLAERLRILAARTMARLSGGATIAHTARTSATGELTVAARQISGREALVVSGSGPANVPVDITLRGELSSDLPRTLIRRLTVVTDADGNFSIAASYGPDTHRYTFVSIEATSLPGVTPARTRFVIGLPSPDVLKSGLDVWPDK